MKLTETVFSCAVDESIFGIFWGHLESILDLFLYEKLDFGFFFNNCRVSFLGRWGH